VNKEEFRRLTADTGTDYMEITQESGLGQEGLCDNKFRTFSRPGISIAIISLCR